MNRIPVAAVAVLFILSVSLSSLPSLADTTDVSASESSIPDTTADDNFESDIATPTVPDTDPTTEKSDDAPPATPNESSQKQSTTGPDLLSLPSDAVPSTPTQETPSTMLTEPSPEETVAAPEFMNQDIPEPSNGVLFQTAATVEEPSDPDSIDIPDIIISEVQIAGNVANDDFIELYNPGSDAFSLKGFELRRRTKADTTTTGSPFHAFSATDTVPAKGYFLWANKDGSADFVAFADAKSPNTTSPALAANNSIALFDSDKTLMDATAWGIELSKPFASDVNANPEKNTSLVRDLKTLSWSVSTHPTPTNSKGQTVKQPDPVPPIGTIVINELLPNPDTGSDEWIEIRNTDDETVSLEEWKIRDASSGGGYTFPTEITIGPNGYLILVGEVSKIALNNTGHESVTLIFPDGSIADTYSYDGAAKGASFARNDSGDFLLTHSPTPGRPNAFDPEPVSVPTLPAGVVRISELFPNPRQKGEGNEWIEIENTGTDPVGLVGWALRSGSGKFTWTEKLPEEQRVLPAGGFLLLPRSLTKLAMRNSNGAVSLFAPDSATLMDSVSYGTTAEEASYGFFAPGRFRWSKTLTPGSANVFGKEPTIKKSAIPKKGYVNMLVPFSATGNKKNMRFVWDFGDGHKSYLPATSHRFLKSGTYEGTLTLRDGIEEAAKPFTITVGKYPKRHLHITEIFPNPTGKDTGNEWIRLRNDDSKKIDLVGWVIATATEKTKLVNHVILTDRPVGPGEEILLTHTDSRFTLPNERATIELRSPDGKTTQTIQYDFGKSVPNDSVYAENGNGWTWILRSEDDSEKETIAIDITDEEEAAQKEQSESDTGMTENPDADRLAFDEFITLGTPYRLDLPDSAPLVLGASDERLQSDVSPSDTFLDTLFRILNGFATGVI